MEKIVTCLSKPERKRYVGRYLRTVWDLIDKGQPYRVIAESESRIRLCPEGVLGYYFEKEYFRPSFFSLAVGDKVYIKSKEGSTSKVIDFYDYNRKMWRVSGRYYKTSQLEYSNTTPYLER